MTTKKEIDIRAELIDLIESNFTVEELNTLAGMSLDFYSKNEEGTELDFIAWDEN